MTIIRPRLLLALTTALALTMPLAGQAFVQTTAFTQALAEAASDATEVASFYAARAYAPVWTGPADTVRRQVLLSALDRAGDHGLPVARYDAAGLRNRFAAAVTEGDRGRLEMAMTRAFLDFAADLSAGALVPGSVDGGILREVPRPDPVALLARIEAAGLDVFLAGLAPKPRNTPA